MSIHHHISVGLSSALKKVTQLPINVIQNGIGLDLDISFIDTGIMVCSYPVVESKRQLVRNKLEDLITYLNTIYGLGNWRLYNLKSEVGSADYSEVDLFNKIRSSPSVTLDTNLLQQMILCKKEVVKHNKILYQTNPELMIKTLNDLEPIFVRKGWLDHFPPPFDLLQEIIDDMNQFLTNDDSHIVILHCKMGKGRSGTICVAYLMKYRNMSFEDSMQMFTKGRFKRMISQGVSINSQLRYLQYHKYFLSFSSKLQKLLLNGLKSNYSYILSSIKVKKPTKLLLNNHTTWWLNLKRYNPTRTGLITLDTIDLSTHIRNGMKEGCDTNGQGNLNFPIYLNNADLMFEFELKLNHKNLSDSIITTEDSNDSNSKFGFIKKIKESKILYAWVNVLLESLKFSLLSQISQDLTCVDANFNVMIDWGEIDTVIPHKKTGLKLFDSIEFHFEQSSF